MKNRIVRSLGGVLFLISALFLGEAWVASPVYDISERAILSSGQPELLNAVQYENDSLYLENVWNYRYNRYRRNYCRYGGYYRYRHGRYYFYCYRYPRKYYYYHPYRYY